MRKLKAKAPVRVWRIECNPGEEAQVDRGGAGKRSQWDRKEKEYALGGK